MEGITVWISLWQFTHHVSHLREKDRGPDAQEGRPRPVASAAFAPGRESRAVSGKTAAWPARREQLRPAPPAPRPPKKTPLQLSRESEELGYHHEEGSQVTFLGGWAGPSARCLRM